MLTSKKLNTIAAWTVFAVALVVYYLSAERVGSLWDCGEFILGAYKLQVVHPPGAPLFMIIGRMFTYVAELFSDNPSNIAFAVNLMSGVCTAFAAMFAGLTTSLLARMTVSKEEEPDFGTALAIAGAGLVGGLITAFCTSIWFSAVEGEVYAMSTFFTAMTIWSAVKWYSLPNEKQHDRWLVFSLFTVGLSVGVHLLSLLALPALGLLFYYKKFNNKNIFGALISIFGGIIYLYFIQKLIIVGVPSIWKQMEMAMVNGMGLPFHSGLIPTILLLGGLAFFLLKLAHKRGWYYLQLFTVIATLNVIGFSLIGVIVIRANADTPVNMNAPSDAMRLLPYINREQYGERPLLYGPHFLANPVSSMTETKKVYGRVGDRYEHVSNKVSYNYRNKDKILFPRMSDQTPSRQRIYNLWRDAEMSSKKAPTMGENLAFMMKYQVNWMYFRYFMWNFAGRQNGTQGYFSWDVSSGNWRSGIGFIDNMRLYDDALEPASMKNNKANNNYYFLPLILGLIGLFWHLLKRPKDFVFLAMLFLITGLGIIFYTNQPPNEPRERDYALVGSFLTFSIWAGFAVMALFQLFRDRLNLKQGFAAAGLSIALALAAPVVMLNQNFDDHDRSEHRASRDYATNFLNSVEKDAIIFTYGDNDTYPLWYAQEVENVRPDVRVVNLSLIAVDWYINKLRNKMNESEPLKFSITKENYRGYKRNVLFFDPNNTAAMPFQAALKVMNSKKRIAGATTKMEGYVPTKKIFIPFNDQLARKLGIAKETRPTESIVFNYPANKQYLQKDEIAILDIIGSNIHERPIYFAVTCENSKLQGINDYTQLEGLALRVVPYKTKGMTQGGIAYSGDVAAEKAYDNIMNKWKWGNFDTKELFVDDSYGAATYAMRTVMKRTAAYFLQNGDKAKAVELSKKYFEAFPNMNFKYTYDVMPFMEVLVRGGALDDAKKHIRIMANECKEHLDFFQSIDPKKVEQSMIFRRDMQRYIAASSDLLRMSEAIGDSAFTEEMKNIVGIYDSLNRRK